MDFFGIGAALLGAARIYFRSARCTGRTTSLAESIKDGDRVVFVTNAEAGIFRHRVRDERGIDVECIAIDPQTIRAVMDLGQSKGRTIFDHHWVEKYYLARLASAQGELAFVEGAASAHGKPPDETRLAKMQEAKFAS